MNTNRFLIAPQRRTTQARKRSAEPSKLFWAVTSVFIGLLLAVIYCLLTEQISV